MKLAALVCVVLLVGAGCGDDDPAAASDGGASDGGAGDGASDASSGGGCRGSGDCTAPGESCYGPNDTMCGIPPREACADDGECGKGLVCHAIADSCSADGIGSECGPACSAGSCGDGFACDGDGCCRPVVCGGAGGVECATSELCDPESVDPEAPVHAITHGCTRIGCQRDAACPASTVCVNGRCQDGPGTCSPPAP